MHFVWLIFWELFEKCAKYLFNGVFGAVASKGFVGRP